MRGPGRRWDEVLGDQKLGRLQPLQLRQPVRLVRGFKDTEPPAGQIQPSQGAAFADLVDPHQQVVSTRLEQAFVGDGAGGDDAADTTLDRPLAGRGRAHLLADHRRLAESQEPREIAFQGVVRYAGHGDGQACRFAALGEGEIEQGRPAPGILEEELVEVPHAIEQEMIRVLGLDAQVLLHHRRMAIEGRCGRLGARWIHECRRKAKRAMVGDRRRCWAALAISGRCRLARRGRGVHPRNRHCAAGRWPIRGCKPASVLGWGMVVVR